MKTFSSLICLFSLLTMASNATAGEKKASVSGAEWRFESALRGRSNRTGVGTRTTLLYRVPLGQHDHILLRGAAIEVGSMVSLSPASFDPGVFLRVIPIAPILLGVSAQHLRWYGTFGNLSSFPGLEPDWSPDTLHDRSYKQDVGAYGTGYRLVAQGMLRLKLGPVVGLLDTQYKWIGADVPPGTSFCPAMEDLLVARRDRILTVKGDLLYFIVGRPSAHRFIMAGLHYEAHQTHRTRVERQIVGGIAGWRRPTKGPWTTTLAGIVGVYAEDPYRVGEHYIGFSLSLERTWAGD